jgi:hypothetical protein
MEGADMKVFLGTYHGEDKEKQVIVDAGFATDEWLKDHSAMHLKEPIEGCPFEIAKKIHNAAKDAIKVAIGDFKNNECLIFVSIDWFKCR